MRNFNDITSRVSLTKNLVSDQTTNHIQKKLNTSGLGFNVTEGFGAATATSSAFIIAAGGFSDQQIITNIKFVSPTTVGLEDIGAMLRCQTLDSPNATYYYARVDAGLAKITRVVDGTFTTLTSTSYLLPQGEVVTVDFKAVGNQLTAVFTASTPGAVTLSAVDSQITVGGTPGVRSITSTLWCRDFTVNQL